MVGETVRIRSASHNPLDPARGTAPTATAGCGVSCTLVAKADGPGGAAPTVWRWVPAQAPGPLGTQAIKWNFTKCLIAKDGRTVKRYGPTDTPASIRADIEAALAA